MSKYFYCPNCETEDLDFKFKSLQEENQRRTWRNIRDGYGMTIYHLICPICNNPLSGYMQLRFGDEEETEYCKSLICFYNKDCENDGYFKEGDVEILKERLLKDKEIELINRKGGK